MLFTRTIRRKLLLGLALVLTMLLTVSVSSIWGLWSFRNVVRNFDYAIDHAPHQAEIVSAIGLLLDPVRFMLQVDDQAKARFQQARFDQRMEMARAQILDFRHKLERMPPTELPTGQRWVTETFLRQIEFGLDELLVLQVDAQNQWKSEVISRRYMERLLSRAAGTPLLRLSVEESVPDTPSHQEPETTARRMLEKLSDLQVLAQEVPDPVAGLGQMLLEARTVYRSSLILVWSTTAVSVVLFFGLVRYGYLSIFAPLRKLHQGALRVAHGDFDYRVRLATRDEMAELAEAFNKMTCRFQEIAADLDRQVQERSQQLVRSERLAGVGFLAAGVAHEINNPLSAISMASESLEDRTAPLLGSLESGDANVVRQYLQLIQSEAFRCKEITERLLDFSRGRETTRESTDVSRLVSEVVAMVQYLTKYRDKKIDYPGSAPCYAEVNGPEIKQVVLNLVANGLEAMPPGKTLHIELIDRTDHVLLNFRDEGCGMTPDVLSHLFEPFFTQKQVGQGTGLGLSISHRIIGQHGGTVTATSLGPGQGSTFTVRLPRKAALRHAA